MKILLHTDHTITGNPKRTQKISGIIESALDRLGDHLTRVDVHVSDQNSRKAGTNDIRCVIEARLRGRKLVAVAQKSRVLEEAVEVSAQKVARLIRHTLDRRSDPKRHPGNSKLRRGA